MIFIMKSLQCNYSMSYLTIKDKSEQIIMKLKIFIFLLFIALCRGELTELRKLELRPSFSYLTFTSPLSASSSNVVIDQTKMFILAKECKFGCYLSS